MAGKWDSLSKLLIGARPWQYVNWLLGGATLLAPLNIELMARHLFADALLKVLVDGKQALLHVEFQTYEDDAMERRMLEYNVLAERQYDGLPVCSFVIYLQKRKVAQTPYVRRFVDGQIVHQFHFRVVKLWEVPAQFILDQDLDGLLPLLPLTMGGKEPEVISIMVNRLAKSGDKNLLSLAEMVGGLVFSRQSEKTWFERKFAMLDEILKESWVYQKIVNEGLQEGRQQGREEGRQQGWRSSRQTIIDLVNRRFPALSDLASRRVADMTDLDALRILTVELASAQDLGAARVVLLAGASDD